MTVLAGGMEKRGGVVERGGERDDHSSFRQNCQNLHNT